MGCASSVVKNDDVHSDEDAPLKSPLKSPLRLSRATSGRRLEAKSRPFWQIQQEKKQSATAASSSPALTEEMRPSAEGSSRDVSRESSSRSSPEPSELVISWPTPTPSRKASPVNENFPERAVISNSRDLDLLLDRASLTDIEWPSPPQASPEEEAKAADERPDERPLPMTSKPPAAPVAERPLPLQPAAERPLPLQPKDENATAPLSEVCTIGGGGCGCGDDAPPALDPFEWIALLQDERSRQMETEWHAKLSAEQFRVLRMKGTEEVHTGEYNDLMDAGQYNCAACDRPLYASAHKFKSGHGWPAFCDNFPEALSRTEIKKKVEICCAGCGGHVGHVFKSKRYPAPTHERHCANSISLVFVPQVA